MNFEPGKHHPELVHFIEFTLDKDFWDLGHGFKVFHRVKIGRVSMIQILTGLKSGKNQQFLSFIKLFDWKVIFSKLS